MSRFGGERFRRCCVIALLLGGAALARAQQPFNTDDDGVTDYHKRHVEVADEYDKLQHEALPSVRQNTFNVKFAYGIAHHVEVGIDDQLIRINNTVATPGVPKNIYGFGDLDLDVKWHFRDEHASSFWPAMAMSFAVEVPTGNAKQGLGSGVADYSGDLIFHKSLSEKTKWNLNTGMVFAGNTQTGALGLKTRGTLFLGSSSVLHDFTPRLRLGAEVTGVAGSSFDLGRGALQLLGGGNYSVRKNVSLDFAVTGGWFVGAPRVGSQVGFSVDW